MNHLCRVAQYVGLCVGLVASVLVTGCTRLDKHRLAISGDAPDYAAISRYDVNVTNASGTVEIATLPDISEPWIQVKRSRERVEGMMAGPGTHPERYSNATLSEDGGVGTLTVNSTAGDVGSAGEWVKINIWVPAVGSVKVRNAGGRVRVEDFSGAVDIQNASTRLGNGSISVSTGIACMAPISLTTDDGFIQLTVPDSSAFVIDASSGEGNVGIAVRNSVVSRVVDAGSTWNGIVNAGTATATLRTIKGNIGVKFGKVPF